MYKVKQEKEILRAVEELGELLFKLLKNSCSQEIDPEIIRDIQKLSKIINSN